MNCYCEQESILLYVFSYYYMCPHTAVCIILIILKIERSRVASLLRAELCAFTCVIPTCVYLGVCMCVWFFVICLGNSTCATNSPAAPSRQPEHERTLQIIHPQHPIFCTSINNDPCDWKIADKNGLYLQYPSACPQARFGSPANHSSHFACSWSYGTLSYAHAATQFDQGLVCWNHEAGLKVLMESIWRRMERHDEQQLLFVLPSFRYMMQSWSYICHSTTMEPSMHACTHRCTHTHKCTYADTHARIYYGVHAYPNASLKSRASGRSSKTRSAHQKTAEASGFLTAEA